MSLLSTTAFPQANRVFNNGRIRIGDGTQHSINSSGNLLQPFYNDGVTFYKLTFSSYPLNIKWAIGGDGTDDWNLNGVAVSDPIWSNQTFDYSGFTVTDALTGVGYGTIITTGNITLDGKLFLVKNTYTLPQSEGYMAITVKLTNLSGASVDNIRLWVGTRDDYIAIDDSPSKKRGNIVNSVFEQITNTTDQAKAVKIYGDRQADDGAVMFYSNSDRAETLIHITYSWDGVTSENPDTNPIEYINDDGSYAMYVRFNDLENDQSDELTWYYAAGKLSEIDDIVAAVALAAGSMDNISYTSADFKYTYTETGKTYFVLVNNGATVPSAAQIKAGVNYPGGTVIISDSVATTADVENIFNLTGLNDNTSYSIYAVTEYDDAGSMTFSDIKRVNFTTLENDTPVGSLIADQTTCFNTPITGLLLNITDEYPGDETFTVTGSSSNTNIVENSGISITGTGASRTISVTPKTGASGTCTITIGINDSDYSPAPPSSLKVGPIAQTTVTFDVTVRDEFTPGAILSTGEDICAGGDPSLIGNSTAANGGDGAISYKWESSTDAFATAGTLIVGANGATYDPPAGLGTTTSYRRYAHDGTCNTDFEVSAGTWTVTVNPSVTAIAQDVTVYLDASGNGSTTAALVNNGSSSCNGISSMVLSKSNFTCADIGENEIVLTVTDNFANTATATAIVTVVDNINPTIFVRNVTVNLDANGSATVTAAMINNGSFDNCAIESMVLSKTTFNCSNIGQNIVTLTVTDKSGNTTARVAIVTVRDNTPPVLMLSNDLFIINRVDGKYVTFDIRQLVGHVSDNSDACDQNLTVSITKASSDEAEDAPGREDGSTTNDIVITADGQEIQLRAETTLRGNGRVYTIYFEAVDGSGNTTERRCRVMVNSRGNSDNVDDGAVYWAFPGGFGPFVAPAPVAVATLQNTPNPFKSTTLISFNQEKEEYVNLAIYNMSGQLIKTLISEVKPVGIHSIRWEADDDEGELVPAGMYIYILKTNDEYISKKMLLLK